MEIDWRTQLKVNDKIVLLALDEEDEAKIICYANILEIGTDEIQIHSFSPAHPDGSIDTVQFPMVFGRISEDVYEEALELDMPGMDWFIVRMTGDPNWHIYVDEDYWRIRYHGREFVTDTLDPRLLTRH